MGKKSRNPSKLKGNIGDSNHTTSTAGNPLAARNEVSALTPLTNGVPVAAASSAIPISVEAGTPQVLPLSCARGDAAMGDAAMSGSAVGETLGAAIAGGYPSDGPSYMDDDDEPIQTSSETLQAKLDQLGHYIALDDKSSFVLNFVPLDVSPADTQVYLHTLQNEPNEWNSVTAELQVIATGVGVTHIEGDQCRRAVFHFPHPLYPNCDREVAFTCCELTGEWRAEG